MPAATFVSEGPASSDYNVARTRLDKPLAYSGLLDSYTHSDLTTVIGTEYEGLQVVDLLSAKNSDALIRDLAVTISRRGVVFLRNQDVTPQQMRELMEKITELAGSVSHCSADDSNVTDLLFPQPESSSLHVHPLTEEGSELGDQISVISSEKQKKCGGLTHQLSDTSRYASVGLHSDITFEGAPSDYAMLKIHTLPETGGDTVSIPSEDPTPAMMLTVHRCGHPCTKSTTACRQQWPPSWKL